MTMPNTREKLIELLREVQYQGNAVHGYHDKYIQNSELADHIIASGFIEELQNEAYDLGVDSALHNHFGLSWEDASGLRKEVTRLQNSAKWIPVSERLPAEDETALVIDRVTGEVTTAHLNFFKSFVFRDGRGHGASHWMPLPEKPKEG